MESGLHELKSEMDDKDKKLLNELAIEVRSLRREDEIKSHRIAALQRDDESKSRRLAALQRDDESKSRRLAALEVNDPVTKALADDAIRVRTRFIETYRRSKRVGGDATFPWHQSWIIAGHKVAHGGKVHIDATLYNMGRRTDTTNFFEIYGVSIEDFNTLYKCHKELYEVFNFLGTIVVEAAIVSEKPSEAMRKAFTDIIQEVKHLQQQGFGGMIDDLIWSSTARLGELWGVYEAAFLEEKARFNIHR